MSLIIKPIKSKEEWEQIRLLKGLLIDDTYYLYDYPIAFYISFIEDGN